MWKRVFSVIACCLIVILAIPMVSHSSDIKIHIAYTPHDPIRINSNSDFNQANGIVNWATGNGTIWNPWLIEGWDINGTGYGTCIFIGNTTDYFVIKECNLHDALGPVQNNYQMDAGIHLYFVDNGQVSNNTISWGNSGIYCESSNDNEFRNNSVHHSPKGIYLLDEGLIPCLNNFIINNDISDTGVGVYIRHSPTNGVINNSISWNDNWIVGDGIILDQSPNTTISFNTIENSEAEAIELWLTNDIIIENNTLLNNNLGIYIFFTEFTTLINNTMDRGGIYLLASWDINDYNTHVIDTSNTVQGKPIYYFKNQFGGTAPGDASQIILSNCSNISIMDLTFSDVYVGVETCYSENITIEDVESVNNSIGIDIRYTHYSTISESTLSSNELFGLRCTRSNRSEINRNVMDSNGEAGLRFSVCHNNTVNLNSMSNNGIYGASFSGATRCNNLIFHNNFINNANQAKDRGINNWNRSHWVGGNYWSDYTGVDLMRGPLQDQPGSDGKGDTNYSIEGEGQNYDEYPLMMPYQNLYNNWTILLNEGWNLVSLPLIQNNESIDQALQSIDGIWDCIQIFDSLSQEPWKSNAIFKPIVMNDFYTLNHKQGFWINITDPGETILIINGYDPSFTSIPLLTGWNLVGYPSLTNETVANALWGTGADKVMVCDTSEPYHIKEVGPTYLMKPGEGYWVHVPADAVWVVDW